jgi:[citrate (pro-3S)-lyase] ligase
MHIDNFYDQTVDINNKKQTAKIDAFLKANGLSYEQVEYTVQVVNQNNKIVGTGSVTGKILRCFAIDPEYRETDVFSIVMTHLLNYLSEKGVYHSFVFTKPGTSQSFRNLGFKEIERAAPLFVLMEQGVGGLKRYQGYLKRNSFKDQEGKKIGACIVNCNPFTLGHLYLIEKAAKQLDYLYIIVVQENLSVFPFDVRFDLVKKGTNHLKNVSRIRGGEYVVSSSTFPTYFVKNEDPGEIERLQAEMDLRIFCKHIAPILGVTKRMVGTEDYCKTTTAYNEAMTRVLPQFGIDIEIVPRKKLNDDMVISASHVRRGIKDGNWDLVEQLVPKTTMKFLKSKKAIPIIEKIKNYYSRH